MPGLSGLHSSRALLRIRTPTPTHFALVNTVAQMGKQTMGFPLHAHDHRSDNKLYCLRTPQTPLVRCRAYDEYNMDTYPTGTNAIVAVISYTVLWMGGGCMLGRGLGW